MVKCVKYFSFLFFISCSSLNLSGPSQDTRSGYRSLANKESLSDCVSAINSLKYISDYDIVGTSSWRRYHRYTDDYVYSKELLDLQKRAKRYQQIGGREYSKLSMEDNDAYFRIINLMKVESSFNIAKRLEYLFRGVETGFFIIKEAFNDKEALELLYQRATTQSDKDLFKRKILEKDDIIIEWGIRMDRFVQRYKTTRKFLEKSQFDSPEEKEKARQVLNYLDIKKLLKDCPACGDVDSLHRPAVSTIEKYLTGIRPVQIHSHRARLNFELLMSAMTILPVRYVAEIFDRIISRVWVIRDSNFRNMIRQEFLDLIQMAKFFPNIDQLIKSKANDEELTDAFMRMYAKAGSTSFLLAFARRVDASTLWGRVYDTLSARAGQSSDVLFSKTIEQMDKAKEDAGNLGLLPEWHTPEWRMTARFLAGLTASALLVAYSDDAAKMVGDGLEEVEDYIFDDQDDEGDDSVEDDQDIADQPAFDPDQMDREDIMRLLWRIGVVSSFVLKDGENEIRVKIEKVSGQKIEEPKKADPLDVILNSEVD